MRYCFNLRVNPDLIDEYTAAHQQVWPEMQEALLATGWRNYSLFLRGDGLLIGYVESDDLAAAQRAMDATTVNERWQREMARFFVGTDGKPADQAFVLVPEVFHLADPQPPSPPTPHPH
jgi:L-rhamnose mutarotase